MVWGFALTLMVFGLLLTAAGWSAAVTRYYEMEWTSWGPFSGGPNGLNVFRGADAVRVGTGLVLSGVMLVIWGIAAVRTVGASGRALRLTSAGRAAAWVSLLCVLGGAGCLVPPWHLQNLTFYGLLLLPVVILLTLEGEERRRWGGRLVVALFLTALVCGPGVLARVAAGIFTPLFAAMHVMLLFPDLMKMKEH